MHAAVAALARRHGLSAALASEIDALVSATPSGGSAPASTSGSSADPTVLRSPGPDPTLLLREAAPGGGVRAMEPDDRYLVVGELGRGGMGEVQRVLDRWLNRVVARKVMHAALSDALRGHFFEEAQTTAQLQHPGIVPVYDLGEQPDGRLWFTMKEIHGETLRSVVRAEHRAGRPPGDGPSSLRRLVTHFHAVCQAVGFAHERSVIHRDLKPSNVMVGSHGEVVVVDWGIAKVLSAGAASPAGWAQPSVRTSPAGRVREPTLAGGVVGTPAFMAPEQARGDVASIGVPSDVYALGGILYELLSGSAPYRGHTEEVLAEVVAGPPPSLRGAAGARGRETFGVDLSDLVEVCERAMARSPTDRYPQATAVAEAVQAWLDGSRRREQALAVVVRAAAQGPAAAALRSQAAALRAEATAALRDLPGWRPEEDKAPAWAKEDEAAEIEARAALMELEEESLLRASLTHAPELPEAHAALAERYWREHATREAEKSDPTRVELLLRQHLGALPEAHPVRRAGAAYLKGDGAFTLLTDPPGAEVALLRYETRNRRRVPVPVRELGRTPLRGVSLPMGSYLCQVRHPDRAPVHYPLWVRRGDHWDGAPPGESAPQPVYLPRRDELGPEDCYVPAGWFASGGDREAPSSLPRRWLWVDGQVFRRFPVRNREYLAFLNARVAAGREDEALRFAPRERAGIAGEQGAGTAGELGALIYGFDGQRFSLRPDRDGDGWDPEWPVVMVDWHSAAAFAAWAAERSGLPWRLPGELEWEKAARGVDGRRFPWGDGFDPSWACTGLSHRGRPLPAVVDTFPVDESPYGVRGLGGNVRDWCADAYAPEGPPAVESRLAPAPRAVPAGSHRVGRGGSWTFPAQSARVAYRSGYGPGLRYGFLGLRLLRPIP